MLVGNVHLVSGDATCVKALCDELAKTGINVHGADAYVRAYEHFGIDEARELVRRAGMRPVVALHRTFILAFPTITPEAQNALLKTLEEPPAGAVFFFVLPSPEALLATFRSRAQPYVLKGQDTAATIVSPEAFLSAEPRERLAMLTPLLEKTKEDTHNMNAIFTFLSSLERTMAKRGATPALKDIYRARTYMNDKGSLKKILLEHIALLLPRA